jgi:hypothetical protein
MNPKLLESVNSSRHPGAFVDGIDEQDERELIRLLSDHCDADDCLHLLALIPLRRKDSHVMVCEYSELFGKRVWKRRHLAERKQPSRKVGLERFDVYEMDLHANFADPGLQADLHAAEEMCSTTHPEQGDDEFFLGNIDVDTFRVLTWKTKRIGLHAYSASGTPLASRFRPLFVTRDEVFQAGLPAEVCDELQGQLALTEDD